MKAETGDLLAWGKRTALGAESMEQRAESARMEVRISSMKSALMEMGVIHADRFREMFGWDERTCRAIAAASEGHILGTNGGYVLTEQATPEEFDAANGRIYSQGRKMLRRAIQERRVRHQLVGRS